MHLLSQIIYTCKTLYMSRTVSPSFIRSSKLRIKQRVYVKQLLLPAAIGDEMEFHFHPRQQQVPAAVSDGLSVHHQELKTAYTATIYVKQLLLSEMRWSSISFPGDETEFHLIPR